MADRHPLFYPVIVLGGLVEGFGLAYSQMAKPEVVLGFLQLDDFGLLLVMVAAAVVIGAAIFAGVAFLGEAPLTGTPYRRRLTSMDRNVLVGGAIFGVGWGVSGICPGAGYASVGIGNYPILVAIAAMFLGAYAQGYWRARTADDAAGAPDAVE
ncbi:putative membrane protein YedE/YeeE [Halarchaeum solikamskense]|uniref:DUF6691 family protein n=1 Tax=Halarchaeum nitratireducens TaxID=489913 RepID=UPI001B3A8C15|nr:DUF6691 family protein [Halarchaeum solikamskense]MBP2250959.1 putative membrane protein YedE/YeeE [Halarchaeum solikamskense]